MREFESGWRDIQSGVTQGLVLGLNFLAVYMNDLPGGLENLIKMYVDDCKVFSDVDECMLGSK